MANPIAGLNVGHAEGRADSAVPIAVLGAGSWGTALAILLARGGRSVRLWGRDRLLLERLATARRNERYLPAGDFPPGLAVVADLGAALQGALDVLIAVPSTAFRELLAGIAPHLRPEMRLAWATKGFEQRTGRLPHQIAHELLGAGRAVAVLSGPTFAREVGAGLPTAMTVASSDPAFAAALARDLSSGSFRAYTSDDIMGVEIGGAVKNVLAIGAGMSDGLGYGANSRVALITRGLAEMVRLGAALGARRETFMGLAGLGDLVLSCTDDQSRNRRFGLALAAGHSAAEALASIGQVVEGYGAARAVHEVATAQGVEMPLCTSVFRVLHAGVPPRDAVRALMSRPMRAEAE